MEEKKKIIEIYETAKTVSIVSSCYSLETTLDPIIYRETTTPCHAVLRPRCSNMKPTFLKTSRQMKVKLLQLLECDLKRVGFLLLLLVCVVCV